MPTCSVRVSFRAGVGGEGGGGGGGWGAGGRGAAFAPPCQNLAPPRGS